jgi:hypothetical protein
MYGRLMNGVLTDHAPRIRRRTTPGIIKTATIAVVLLAVVFATVVAVLFSFQNDAFHAIGTTDAPETTATTGLYFSLTDMDAQVANVLLAGNSKALASIKSGNYASYASDRTTSDSDLQQAAVVASGDPAEQNDLRAVLNDMGSYEGLAAEAMLTDQSPGSPEGRPSATSLGYFQQATDLMSDHILPDVAVLTTDNTNALDASYSSSRSGALIGIAEVVVAGLALAGTLVWLQFFLRRRYHRTLNLGLAAATLVTLILTVTAGGLLGGEADHLKVAKVDAFNSIIALTQARAVSYDANADESRYLVDPARAVMYQNAFLTQSQRIAYVGNVGIFQYDAALAREIPSLSFGGYLGTELHNITFPGERAAAMKTLLAYQGYERDDRKLRAMAKTSLAAAIAFDVGTAPGQSDWAFYEYDTALSSVITINRDAFTTAGAAGSSAATGWTWLIPGIGALLIAGLALAGVRPRLTEYR